MGGVTTTYDVVTRYMTQHQGGPALQQMTTQVQALERSTSSAKSMLASLGAAAAGFLGFEAGKKHLIDFNSEMEQAKLTTAGFMAMSGLGNFNDNLGEADRLVKQYTIDARTSIATTADFVEMSKNLTASVTGAGGSVKDLHDMTKGLVIAAKAMNMDPNFAAMETEEALMGNLTVRNRFAKKILGSIGYQGEEGRKKYQQLGAKGRLSEFQRAMGSDWLKDLAKAQENSFEGAKTTFIDNAQLAAMRAGKVLFQEITKELNKWNDYLIRNQEKIDHIADAVGKNILMAFKAIKEITIFVHDHWKSLALILVGLKMPGMVAGFAGGLAGTGASTVGASGMFAGLTGFSGQLGIATAGLTLFAAGLTEAAAYIDRKQDAGLAFSANYGVGVKGGTIDALISSVEKYRGSQTDAERKSNAQVMMALAKNQGISDAKTMEEAAGFWSSDQRMAMARAMGQKGNFDTGRGIRQEMGFVSAEDVAKAFDETRMSKVIQEWMPDRSGMNEGNGLGFYAKYNAPSPKIEKPKVNVTIHKIEVASDDPDRFSFGFINALRDAARNPSSVGSSIRVLREG